MKEARPAAGESVGIAFTRGKQPKDFTGQGTTSADARDPMTNPDEKAKPGARVRLRSGGPEMVVERSVGRVLHCSHQDGARRVLTSHTAPSVDLVAPARRA